MSMKKIVAALLGGVALAPAAFAQEADAPKYYWWAGYGTGEFDQDFSGDTARLGTLQGKLGWRLHRNFGVEGEAAFGVDEDKVFFGHVKVKYEYGAFAVGYLPVLDTVDLFARAGYAQVELESDVTTASSQGSSGAAFGAGGVWYVGPLDVRFEYTRYQTDNDADAYMISLGSRF
jgi:outer membrane immunogenic protein